jgi:hypothetical protein
VKPESEPSPAETPSSDAHAFPDWMEEIGAGAAAAVPSVVESPRQPATVGQVISEQPVTEQPILEQLSSGQPDKEQTFPSVEIPEWLEEPGETPVEASGIPIQEPDRNPAEIPPTDLPDGLFGEASASTSGQPLQEVTPDDGEKSISELPSEAAAKSAVQSANAEENTMTWLEQLSVDQVTNPEVPSASAERNQETKPDAYQELADTQPVVQPLERSGSIPLELAEKVEGALGKPSTEPPIEEKPAVTGEELPEWLKGLESLSKPVQTPKADDDLPEWLGNPIVNEGAVPGFLESKGSAEAAGEMHLELPVPTEPQPVGADAIQIQDKSTVPAEAAGTSNIVFEPKLPGMPVMKPGSEPSPAETPSSDAHAFPDWMEEIGAGAAAAVPSVVESPRQPATVGQVVSEQPVTEQPASEQPILEQFISGEPVPEKPVLSDSLDEEPLKPLLFDPGTVGDSSQPTGEIKPLIIGDRGLDNLMAGQGDRPEELLTNPQDRSTEFPDWLQESSKVLVEASGNPVQEPDHTPAETPPLEPPSDLGAESSASTSGKTLQDANPDKGEKSPSELPPDKVGMPAVQPVSNEEDTLAWLERLSVDQVTTPEVPLASAERNQETTPEALQELTDTEPVEQALVESVPFPSESAEKVEGALGNPSIEPPSEEKSAAASEELPEWLQGLESLSKPVQTPRTDNHLPKSQFNPIPIKEPESTSESEELAWVDENMPDIGQALPTTPEEWIPVEEKLVGDLDSGPTPEFMPVDENPLDGAPVPVSGTIPVSKPEPPAESIPVAESGSVSEITPISKPEPPAESVPLTEPVSSVSQDLIHPVKLNKEGTLTPVPFQDKDSEILSNAQTALDQNSLDEAMKQYTKLIKKGHLLNDVTHDLREAIHRHPLEVNIWQTLGDAYMRANRLQDALDAYTKAEELLR